VDDGLSTMVAEAACESAGPRIMVGGGLRLDHLRAAGLDAFHIGGAARLSGWDTALDAPVPVG
jgi:copper homeostasis protein